MARKISLSWFLILSILSISLLPVIGYAFLSLNFFEKGLDAVMEVNLVRTAQKFAATHTDIREGLHICSDTQIALRWEDMPADVRERLATPPEKGRLYHIETADDRSGRPPQEIAFLMRVVADGRDFYVLQVTTYNDDPVDSHSHEIMYAVMAVSLASPLALFIFSLFLVRKVTRQVSALSQWAASLDAENLTAALPDFNYPELNSLAARIRNSMLAERKAVERESRCLRYSSHELRTPISVVRASTECLSKMLEDGNKNPALEQRAVARLQRAGSVMTYLVETLLWLGRNPDAAPALETIDLEQLVLDAVADAQQYYGHRDLECAVETHSCSISLQAGAAAIVVGNIIRNAFQHTLQGCISIRQTGTLVEVTNSMAKGKPEEHAEGFGLGLELTHRLTSRFGWKCETHKYNGRNTVFLHFMSETT